ncbi:hypothetical protein Pelo_16742 [Pelomyxa schiedti]|nr:hypothetical protein Pelo_16742 [Pelomyxa schiedti]
MSKRKALVAKLRLLPDPSTIVAWVVHVSETGGVLDVAPWRVRGYRSWLADTLVAVGFDVRACAGGAPGNQANARVVDFSGPEAPSGRCAWAPLI